MRIKKSQNDLQNKETVELNEKDLDKVVGGVAGRERYITMPVEPKKETI